MYRRGQSEGYACRFDRHKLRFVGRACANAYVHAVNRNALYQVDHEIGNDGILSMEKASRAVYVILTRWFREKGISSFGQVCTTEFSFCTGRAGAAGVGAGVLTAALHRRFAACAAPARLRGRFFEWGTISASSTSLSRVRDGRACPLIFPRGRFHGACPAYRDLAGLFRSLTHPQFFTCSARLSSFVISFVFGAVCWAIVMTGFPPVGASFLPAYNIFQPVLDPGLSHDFVPIFV